MGFKNSLVKDKCPGIVLGCMLSYRPKLTIPDRTNRSIITQST